MKVYKILAEYINDGIFTVLEDSRTVKREAVALASGMYNNGLYKGVQWVTVPTISKVVDGEVVGTLTLPDNREGPIVTGEWGAVS